MTGVRETLARNGFELDLATAHSYCSNQESAYLTIPDYLVRIVGQSYFTSDSVTKLVDVCASLRFVNDLIDEFGIPESALATELVARSALLDELARGEAGSSIGTDLVETRVLALLDASFAQRTCSGLRYGYMRAEEGLATGRLLALFANASMSDGSWRAFRRSSAIQCVALVGNIVDTVADLREDNRLQPSVIVGLLACIPCVMLGMVLLGPRGLFECARILRRYYLDHARRTRWKVESRLGRWENRSE